MKGNFGFIHEPIDIKVLILFILRRLPEPVTFDALTGLVMCDGGISYFDYATCVAELVETEHLKLEDGLYSLTEKGIRNGVITEDLLPFTVRREAENNAAVYRRMQDRNKMIKTSHTVNPDGGCTTNLTLSDAIGDIISMELFAANDQQAEQLERGFRKKAEVIYKTVIDMILKKNDYFSDL